MRLSEHQKQSLEWAHRLTGIEPQILLDARAQIVAMHAPNVVRELATDWFLDDLVGAYLLVRAMRILVDLGVPSTKLESKLRNDPAVWPTWSEISVAAQAARARGATVVAMDLRGESGRRPDLSMTSDHGADYVECKSVGLSDQEANFCARMSRDLARTCPVTGVLTFYAQPGTPRLALDNAQLVHLHRQAELSSRSLPEHVRGLSAVAVVAGGMEAMRAARLGEAVQHALAQLGSSEGNFVALQWTGGGSVEAVAAALSELDLPDWFSGVLLVGVALVLGDPRLHFFSTVVPARGSSSGDFTTTLEFESSEPDDGRLVLEFVERSGHVRPCYVQVPMPGRSDRMVLARRDGRRRILPFVLLLAPDPEEGILVEVGK